MPILTMPHPFIFSDDFKQFLVDLRNSKLYQKWAADNPGELQRLNDYLNDPTGLMPGMKTAFGRAVVLAIKALAKV